MEELLESDTGRGWLDEISEALHLHPNLRSLLCSRIRFLPMRGGKVAFDVVQVDEFQLSAVNALGGYIWSCLLRDSTSPVTPLLGLDPTVLERGIRLVGHIPMPEFISELLAPLGGPKIALRGWGMAWAPGEGGGAPDMGFRAGPFVLWKDGCCHQRRRNTNFAPDSFLSRFFSCPHMCSQNDQRDVGIILSHACWGRTPPPPAASTAGDRMAGNAS